MKDKYELTLTLTREGAAALSLPKTITLVPSGWDELLLEQYSQWLERKGYMDSDWYTEGNTVREFLNENR